MTGPEKIYLQLEGGDNDYESTGTWCDENIGGFDIEYIRADTIKIPWTLESLNKGFVMGADNRRKIEHRRSSLGRRTNLERRDNRTPFGSGRRLNVERRGDGLTWKRGENDK